jgi:hypothetical protein
MDKRAGLYLYIIVGAYFVDRGPARCEPDGESISKKKVILNNFHYLNLGIKYFWSYIRYNLPK